MALAIIQPYPNHVAAQQRRHDEVEVVIVINVDGCHIERKLHRRERKGLATSVRQLKLDSVGGAALADVVGNSHVGPAVRVEIGDGSRRLV